MAYVPKIFKDRAVEFPFRRLLTPVSGQANTVDISRVPGTIFEVGDEPDAANLNAEFGKIKTETDSINTSLTVKQNKTWTLLGSVTGSTEISLTGVTFTELEVVVEYNGTRFKFHILADELSTTSKNYRQGYSASTSQLWGLVLQASSTSINLYELYYNSTNYLTSSTVKVYYR